MINKVTDMKILTLNTHSLVEPDYENKLKLFVEMIIKERPDVFALQEVNQLMAAAEVYPEEEYVEVYRFKGKIREDNHAYRVSRMLKEAGLSYYWTWIGAKKGYDIYDEGMALFSLTPILETRQFYISQSQCYSNWKARKVLGIKTGEKPEWYFCVHMGWWDDKEDPFATQWDNFQEELKIQVLWNQKIWLLGDFNSPAINEDQGYDYVKKHGWLDTWDLADQKDSGVTVEKEIDGWRDRKASGSPAVTGMRLDYIWCNYPAKIKSTKVVFNGKNYPVVSDHYGILIEVEK